MTSTDLKRQFDSDGFVMVPGVLSADDVARLREFFLPILDAEPQYPGDSKLVRMDIASRYPEARELLFNDKMLAAARAVAGDDFVFLPEMSVHDTHFGHWHKDTDTPEQRGESWVWDQDYLMIEVAFYLQDNNEHGGGLDILPGSHRFHPQTRFERFRQKLMRKRPHRIKSRAGDLVLFDFRADHRASKPKLGKRPLEGKDRKVAIFFAASANNALAAKYRRHIESRGDYDYLEGHEYPVDLREQAAEHEVTLA